MAQEWNGRGRCRLQGAGAAGASDHDDDGPLSRHNNANGTATLYDYDGVGRLARITNYASDGTSMSEFGYHYGPSTGSGQAVNNITQIDLSGGARMLYAYDTLDRSTEEARVSGEGAGVTQWSRRYAYDAAGNRTRLDAFDGSTTGVTVYEYNELDQLTQFVVTPSGGSSMTVTCAYDLNGNLVSKSAASGQTVYAYDVANRMVSATVDATTSVQYVYDASGWRIERRVRVAQASGLWSAAPNDPDRVYVFDSLNVLLEMTKTTTSSGVSEAHFDSLDGWTQERGTWTADSGWAKATGDQSSSDKHRWLIWGRRVRQAHRKRPRGSRTRRSWPRPGSRVMCHHRSTRG